MFVENIRAPPTFRKSFKIPAMLRSFYYFVETAFFVAQASAIAFE